MAGLALPCKVRWKGWQVVYVLKSSSRDQQRAKAESEWTCGEVGIMGEEGMLLNDVWRGWWVSEARLGQRTDNQAVEGEECRSKAAGSDY